ncbi:MAG TPA: DNA-binding domain-containing protein [Ramlibacter sp.]
MSLLEVQQAFASALAAGRAVPIWTECGDAEERIDVHRVTIRTILVKALSLNYPAVKRLVGDEFFEWSAALYAEDRLPDAPNLDGYGEGFAEFLHVLPACAGLAYLPDVARLDWAVARALHAPDADALGLDALARAIEHADAAAFIAHPAASLLECSYPADEFWSAVLGDEPGALERIDIARAPCWLLIDRDGTSPRVTRLAGEEAEFARALFAGQSLGNTLARMPAVDAAQWLAGHIAAGRIVGWRVAHTEEKA